MIFSVNKTPDIIKKNSGDQCIFEVWIRRGGEERGSGKLDSKKFAFILGFAFISSIYRPDHML